MLSAKVFQASSAQDRLHWFLGCGRSRKRRDMISAGTVERGEKPQTLAHLNKDYCGFWPRRHNLKVVCRQSDMVSR